MKNLFRSLFVIALVFSSCRETSDTINVGVEVDGEGRDIKIKENNPEGGNIMSIDSTKLTKDNTVKAPGDSLQSQQKSMENNED